MKFKLDRLVNKNSMDADFNPDELKTRKRLNLLSKLKAAIRVNKSLQYSECELNKLSKLNRKGRVAK